MHFIDTLTSEKKVVLRLAIPILTVAVLRAFLGSELDLVALDAFFSEQNILYLYFSEVLL